MEQAAEPVPTQNPDVGAQSGRMHGPAGGLWCNDPVRPVRVVVIGVLVQDKPPVTFAGDQHPVQALAADTGDPPLGDRVRLGRPHRSLDDPRAGRRENGVEGCSEVGVPVAD